VARFTPRGGRMIEMGVGHQDLLDGLAAERPQQRIDVLGDIRPGSMMATLPRPTT